MSAITTYNDALQFLRDAADALDQARAALKDIGLQHLGTGSGPSFVTVSQMADRAEKLVANLQNEECEMCGAPLAGNEVCLEGGCQPPDEDREPGAYDFEREGQYAHAADTWRSVK